MPLNHERDQRGYPRGIMAFDVDLLVIGAGFGGLAAAERAAKHGATVAIATI